MRFAKTLVVAVAAAGALIGVAVAQQSLSPAEQAEARTRVETAVALAEIARADKDGEALLVAARLLSSVGPVVRRGEPAGQSEALYSIEALAAEARSLGADGAAADALAGTPRAVERSYCYWYYNCDSNNNCVWQYIC